MSVKQKIILKFLFIAVKVLRIADNKNGSESDRVIQDGAWIERA